MTKDKHNAAWGEIRAICERRQHWEDFEARWANANDCAKAWFMALDTSIDEEQRLAMQQYLIDHDVQLHPIYAVKSRRHRVFLSGDGPHCHRMMHGKDGGHYSVTLWDSEIKRTGVYTDEYTADGLSWRAERAGQTPAEFLDVDAVYVVTVLDGVGGVGGVGGALNGVHPSQLEYTDIGDYMAKKTYQAAAQSRAAAAQAFQKRVIEGAVPPYTVAGALDPIPRVTRIEGGVRVEGVPEAEGLEWRDGRLQLNGAEVTAPLPDFLRRGAPAQSEEE